MNRFEVETGLQKYHDLYQRGLLSEREFADSYLFRVTDAGLASESERLLGELPPEVAAKVRMRLVELDADQYVWKPMVIGEQPSGAELARLHEQLKIMHHCVCQQN